MINELDLKALWKELDDYVLELDKESKSLQDVWVKIAQVKGKNETEAAELVCPCWHRYQCLLFFYLIARLMRNPEFSFVLPDTIFHLNVGGQIFETSCEILTRDPFSILAAVCREVPLISPNAEGHIYFDRDWWLFRHILIFLKSDGLPTEIETLKELYIEASYYRLESLQRAIENIPVASVDNLTPQITGTWPGLMDGGPNPLRRPANSHILDGSLYKNL